MTRTLRFVLGDIAADWRRSLTHIGAIVPIVAAYLILIAVAGGLRGESEAIEAQDIVLLSPNTLDPSSGRLDPEILDLAREVGGAEVESVSPMIFRPIRMDDRVLQMRAAPFETWEPVHDLTLLSGGWPEDDNDVVITEGIAIATGWEVGTRAEIFGTVFEVSALVRAPGTKFASVWMPFERADRLFEGQIGFQMVTIQPTAGTDVVALLERFEALDDSRFSVYFESELAEQSSARQEATRNLALVSTIVGIAALIFGGFNLAAIALAERSSDIGIGRTVGFSRVALGSVAITRSALLAAGGYVVGGLAALGTLSLADSTTIRSFVFEPRIPITAWMLGAIITVGVSTAGSWVAFDRRTLPGSRSGRHPMIAAARLVLADIRTRTGLVAGAALLVAVPITGFLLLDGFETGIDRDFASQATTDLIVQEANSVGEVAGSRIDPTVEQTLLDLGVIFAIPEIHAVAGSNADNAVLVRGVDLERYRSVASFEVVDGRALTPTDGVDDVMIGVDLAAARGVGAGEVVELRNRPFHVVGVFEIGTYTDNEAWLSLDGARQLLGWDSDISIFVIPDDGTLAEGDVLPGPLSVARRGDVVDLAGEWDPIMELARSATISLAAASAFVLAVVLWRLAWLRRRDLAILRSVGMGRTVPSAYLGGLGLLVALAGLVAGVVGAVALGSVIRIEAFGIVSRAVFEGTSIVHGAVMTGGILVFAVVVATFRILRARPADLLRGE